MAPPASGAAPAGGAGGDGPWGAVSPLWGRCVSAGREPLLLGVARRPGSHRRPPTPSCPPSTPRQSRRPQGHAGCRVPVATAGTGPRRTRFPLTGAETFPEARRRGRPRSGEPCPGRAAPSVRGGRASRSPARARGDPDPAARAAAARGLTRLRSFQKVGARDPPGGLGVGCPGLEPARPLAPALPGRLPGPADSRRGDRPARCAARVSALCVVCPLRAPQPRASLILSVSVQGQVRQR